MASETKDSPTRSAKVEAETRHPKQGDQAKADLKAQTEYLPWLSEYPEVDEQVSMMESEWGAAQTVANTLVAARYASRNLTWNIQMAGGPLYGVVSV